MSKAYPKQYAVKTLPITSSKNYILKEELVMDEELLTLLNEEIKREIEVLRALPAGKEEYRGTVDGLTKLVDRHTGMEKLIIDTDQKNDQLRDERKDRIVKNVINGVGVVGGIALTIWGTCVSIGFEKTGTITTIMGRGFINKLLPRKQ